MKFKDTFIILLALTASYGARASSTEQLTPNGFGTLRIGMTLANIQQARSITLIRNTLHASPDKNNNCQSFTISGQPPALSVMVINGIISRISLYGGETQNAELTIKTDTGLGLNDPEEWVHTRYPNHLESEPHEYLGGTARYLTWWDKQSQRGIRYETSMDQKITAIHAGNEAIFLIEGCN